MNSKGKGQTLVIAHGTWHALSSIAHTCLKPSQPWPVLIYRPRKDGGLSKPRPRVQRATGPRLLRDRLRPAGLTPTTQHSCCMTIYSTEVIECICKSIKMFLASEDVTV